MPLKIQPPKKTRCRLDGTTGKCLNGIEVSLIVREHRLSHVARDRGTRNLALPKTLVDPTLTSKNDEVLQLVDPKVDPADLILVNIRSQMFTERLVLWR